MGQTVQFQRLCFSLDRSLVSVGSKISWGRQQIQCNDLANATGDLNHCWVHCIGGFLMIRLIVDDGARRR